MVFTAVIIFTLKSGLAMERKLQDFGQQFACRAFIDRQAALLEGVKLKRGTVHYECRVSQYHFA